MPKNDPLKPKSIFTASYGNWMPADTDQPPVPGKQDRFKLPRFNNELLCKRVEPVLLGSNLLNKASCTSIALIPKIRHVSVPLGDAELRVDKGSKTLFITQTVHWEECAFLTEEQFTDLFTNLAAEGIIRACEKFGATADGVVELARQYQRRRVEFCPLVYQETVQLESPMDDEYRNRLTEEERVFTGLNPYNWFVQFRPPLKEERINKLSIDTRLVNFNADDPFHADDFVRIANAMLKSPLATLNICHGERSPYWPKLFNTFKWVPRISISHPPNFSGLQHLSPDLLLLDCEAKIESEESLNFLKNFRALKWLSLKGQKVRLDRFENLATLEALRLIEVSQASLNSLSKLSNLQSLEICGAPASIKNLAPVTEIQKLRYLGLIALRLETIDLVRELPNLEFLVLDTLNNLTSIPDMSELQRLRRLQLVSLKRLSDISAIAKIPHLEDLLIYGTKQLTSEDFKCLIGHPTLKSVYVDPLPSGESLAKMLGLTGLNARRRFQFTTEPPIVEEKSPSALEKKQTTKNSKKESVADEDRQELALCIKLTEQFGNSNDLLLYGDLEDQIDQILKEDLLGHVDGNDVGAGFYTIYCVGLDADAMYQAIASEISVNLPKGTYFEVKSPSGNKTKKLL